MQLEKYHEQAQLLDPHVGPIVNQLTQIIRREALSSSGADWDALREASIFLWALITVRCPAEPNLPRCKALLAFTEVSNETSADFILLLHTCRNCIRQARDDVHACRGYKAVVKSFSTEVADLEPVMALLCRHQVRIGPVGICSGCVPASIHCSTYACEMPNSNPINSCVYFSRRGHYNCLTQLCWSSVNGCQGDNPSQDKGTERHEGDWQSDCVLLLWLSQLLLIPFDLAAVDSSIDVTASPHR